MAEAAIDLDMPMKLCVATHHRDQIAINAIVISVENTTVECQS